MILEYRCSNYRSIKEEVIFSMLASSDTSNEEYLIRNNEYNINPTSAIYGANGSGKSSLLESIGFMKAFVVNGIKQQPGDYIPVNPHKLSDEKEASEFMIQFIKNGIRYVYGISLNKEKILKEFLYHFPKGRKAKIFDREEENYTFGKNYRTELKSTLSKRKENRPFLSVAVDGTSITEIKDVFLFFKEEVIIYDPSVPNNWQDYSFEKINSDESFKNKVINIFRDLEICIEDIKTEKHKAAIPEDAFKNLPDEIKSVLELGEKVIQINSVYFDYGKFNVEINEESSGIKKLFEVICPIIDIIENNKVIFWDEIENGLHTSILHTLLDIFIKNKSSKAQLIFTTHDVSLLDLNLLRRDQIWFTELEKEYRSTKLYSLSEFKDVRKTENVGKNYINGRYGAIPFVKTNIQF